MAGLFRPTAAERALIRSAAAREARIDAASVVLQVGRRRSVSGRGSSINAAAISDDPAFADTDFDDEYEPWSAISGGVALTPDRRGIFDLAIRRRGDGDHDLHGHVTVYVQDDVVTRIRGCDADYWP